MLFKCYYSMKRHQVLTPQTRPNLAMLMIDRDVLLTTTVGDLCGRLHSAHLVPLECPIMVVEVRMGIAKLIPGAQRTHSKPHSTTFFFFQLENIAQQCVHGEQSGCEV